MNAKHFKTLGIGIAASMLLVLPSAVWAADAYPSRPVRLIIPWPPGGSSDIIMRPIADRLSERLGKQVLMDNRPGAGAVIGTEMVAKADPDGYTLLEIMGGHTIQPAIQKLPFDPIKSFTMIAKLATGQSALVVHPSVPANSVKDLIALAKQKPGQVIFGATGIGALSHMTAELFKIMADVDIKIVQYKGAGLVMTDLLGGHIHATFNQLALASSYVVSGQLKLLGTGGVKRSVSMPDTPTIAEAGVPGFEASTWWGIAAPAGVPAPIVDRLNKELKAIVASEDLKKRFLKEGAEVDYLGPTEFGPFLEQDIAKWARIVKMANIKLE